jgi:hypothetical protein
MAIKDFLKIIDLWRALILISFYFLDKMYPSSYISYFVFSQIRSAFQVFLCEKNGKESTFTSE